MNQRPLWFVVTKSTILICFLVFQLFWFLPSMRKQSAYRKRMDSVVNASEDCSSQAFATKQYENVSACWAPWDSWIQRNNPPELGIDWPWATWKGK